MDMVLGECHEVLTLWVGAVIGIPGCKELVDFVVLKLDPRDWGLSPD